MGLALGQRPHRATIPASVRRRHNTNPEKRANFMAIYKEVPETPIPICAAQLSRRPATPLELSERFRVSARMISIEGGSSVMDTFEALVQREDNTASQATLAALARMESNLENGLKNLRRRHIS